MANWTAPPPMIFPPPDLPVLPARRGGRVARITHYVPPGAFGGVPSYTMPSRGASFEHIPDPNTTTTEEPKKGKKGKKGGKDGKDGKDKQKEPPKPTGMTLAVKRVDEIYDRTKCEWTTRDSVSTPKHDRHDPYGHYAFTVVRKYNPVSADPTLHMITTALDIKSSFLVKVGKEVVGNVQGISWSAKPLKIDPQTLLAWLPQLEEHEQKLRDELEARGTPVLPPSLNPVEDIPAPVEEEEEEEEEEEAEKATETTVVVEGANGTGDGSTSTPTVAVKVETNGLILSTFTSSSATPELKTVAAPQAQAQAQPVAEPAPTTATASSSSTTIAEPTPSPESTPEPATELVDELLVTHTHLSHLISHLKSEHSATLTELHALLNATAAAPSSGPLSHANHPSSPSKTEATTNGIDAPDVDVAPAQIPTPQITFELLWALLTPRTLLYAPCPVTSAPRVYRIVNAEQCVRPQGPPYWRVDVEYVEANNGLGPGGNAGAGGSVSFTIVGGGGIGGPLPGVGDAALGGVGGSGGGLGALDGGSSLGGAATPELRSLHSGPRFGLATLPGIEIPNFKGAAKITSLPAYPLKYHPRREELEKELIERGKKWVKLHGVHHRFYKGVGYHYKEGKHVRITISSRVMIDWKTFQATIPNYELPIVIKTVDHEEIDLHSRAYPHHYPQQPETELSDADLLMASSIVYGFSLADKLWLEFHVDNVEEFTWNDAAFENLVLPRDQKALIKTLVESHKSVGGFDDFVEGKGQGLVINLFGNPGVGKSLTAEATSEHVRKPLYVVGAGDLGTNAGVLDQNLTRIFTISATWDAVVLIDEADVFLEERSFHNIERNAMVAVFLRQLEYFKGILFLTTNRVKSFDEAFQSRIHVSLRYPDLSPDAKRQIWVAFLRKAGADGTMGGLTLDDLHELGEKRVNGRQIKNVVRTAGALATSKREKIGYKHLIQVLDMMDQFEASNSMYQ